MTVAGLIERLLTFPQDAEVFIHYDGDPRMPVDVAWLTRGGKVAIGAADEPVYDDEARCEGAVSAAENPHLNTTEMLGLSASTLDEG